MSNTILETIRSKSEEIEYLEKALTKAFHYLDQYVYYFVKSQPNEKVATEMIIKSITERIYKLSKEISEILKDNARKEEIDMFAGNKNANESSTRSPDVWHNFYEKIKEVKIQNKNIQIINENMDSFNVDKIFQFYLDDVHSKPIFTAEESKGKCVDMHELFLSYLNYKEIKEYFKFNDYLSYLSNFDRFEIIDIQTKKKQYYKQYIKKIYDYLFNFYKRSFPLADINTVLDSITDQFEKAYEEGNIKGFTEIIQNMNLKEKSDCNGLYCVPCDKVFTNSSVLEYHNKGKTHIKNVSKHSNQLLPDIEVYELNKY